MGNGHITHHELERALELKYGDDNGKNRGQSSEQAAQVTHYIEDSVDVSHENAFGLWELICDWILKRVGVY